MAIPLTWRNVDAPNFSPAFEGMRTAGTFFNNAARAGEGVVDAYTKAQTEEADRAILNRALAFQNSGTFQNALATGAVVGADAPNASLATLRGLDSRVGALLDRDVTRQGYDQRTYENSRTQEGNALMDAATPELAQLRLLARNNDQAGVARLVQGSEALRALRPDQLNAVLTGAEQSGSNFQARRGSDATYSRGMYELGRSVQNDNDTDQAQKAMMTVLRSSGNADDAQRAVEKMATTLSPGAFAKLKAGLAGAGYSTYVPVGGSTTAAAGLPSTGKTATTATTATGVVGLMTGGAQLPDNIRTIGDFVDNKSNLLKTNPKGTATGMYQITADTWADFGPKVFGTNWRSADIRDPNVQDQVGKAIWETVKDNPQGIQGRWASINADEAQKLKGSSWSDVRDLLSEKESSSRASAILADATNRLSNNVGANTASTLLAERAGQNQAVGIFPELNKLQSDRRDASQVVDDLIRSDGALRNSNRGEVLDYVNWIVENSGGRVNPAMAGQLLSRNIQKADNPVVRAGSMIADIVGLPFGRRTRTGNLADGVRLNDQGVYQMLNDYVTGNTSTEVAAQQSLQATNDLIASRRAAYNAAEQQYQAMVEAAKGRPEMVGNLERYKQARDAAETALRRVTQSVVNNDTLTPRFDKPVAMSTGR